MASLLKAPEKKKQWDKSAQQGEWERADDDDESGGDDDADFAPVTSNRRGGISAAVMDFDKPHELVVIPKDAKTMESLTATVKSNVLFEHLEEDELKAVIDAMFPVSPKKGEAVITQGDDGDNFYIIKTGVCDVEIGGKKVGQVPAGGSFGELALMYGTPRAATIRAVENCELFGIDRDTYCRILMGATMRKREMYEIFLAKVKILKDLDKFERATIADAVESSRYSAGDVIITQGDVGDDFFMIVSGECSVTKTQASKTTEVARLGETQYFGEIALLTGDKRKATVTAVTDIVCVRLTRDRFERVLGPCKTILERDMDNYNLFN